MDHYHKFQNRKVETMTIDDIKKLIASDELRTLELKKTTGELKDGMHSACAFLNTEGGWLIFGVAPSSLKIIGQEVTDKTKQEIVGGGAHSHAGVSRFLVGINFRHPNVMPNFAVWKTITYRHWHRWCCQPRF